MRFPPTGVVLFGLLPLLAARGLQAQERDPMPVAVEVVLLLDRSPSANAKGLAPLIEDHAQKMLHRLYNLCQFYGVELRYGAANFGGKLGNVRPLATVSSHADLILPARQKISFTDFRVALRFALESLQRKPARDRSLRIVFLLTDAEPSPATGALDPEGKNRYFGSDKEITPGNLAALKQNFSESAAALYVVALGDRQDDALQWNKLLPSEHYLSNRSYKDLDEAIRRTLLGLLDSSCTQPAVAETAPPANSIGQSSSAFTTLALRRPWYEIVIALAGILVGTSLATAFSRRAINTARTKNTAKAEVPQESESVDELRRKGRKEASRDPRKAKEFFERALEKTEQIAQEGQGFAAAQIPAIFREILTTIYKEDLLAQREYIFEQAGIKSSKERARGLAPVLLERWSVAPELMIEEFFTLQQQFRIHEVLQAFSELETPENLGAEHLDVFRVIRAFATITGEIKNTADIYND